MDSRSRRTHKLIALEEEEMKKRVKADKEAAES